MRVLVTGDREWSDNRMIWSILDGLYTEVTVGHLVCEMSEFVVIEGCARGADSIAGWWADNSPMHSHNERPDDPFFEHLRFPAHWRHDEDCEPDCKRVVGKAAGVIRNQQMLDEGKPELVIAFHDRLWSGSRGTRNMVTKAKAAGLEVWHFCHVSQLAATAASAPVGSDG